MRNSLLAHIRDCENAFGTYGTYKGELTFISESDFSRRYEARLLSERPSWSDFSSSCLAIEKGMVILIRLDDLNRSCFLSWLSKICLLIRPTCIWWSRGGAASPHRHLSVSCLAVPPPPLYFKFCSSLCVFLLSIRY